MQKPSLAFTLLAVFTSPERAAEIEGDLIEESHTCGKGWMRKQVLLVVLSLAARAMARNLASISALCLLAIAAIYLSLMISERVFVGPVGNFLLGALAFAQNAARLAVLSMVMPPLAFIIGAALVRFAPVLGMRAVVALTLVYSILRLAIHLVAIDGPSMIFLSLLKLAVELGLMAVPLLCGGAWAYRRALVRGSADRDPQGN